MKLRAHLDELQSLRRRNIEKRDRERDRLVAKARQLTTRATRCRTKVIIVKINLLINLLLAITGIRGPNKGKLYKDAM